MKEILAFCGEDLAREPLGDSTSKTGIMDRWANLMTMRHASRIVQALSHHLSEESINEFGAAVARHHANVNDKTSWELAKATYRMLATNIHVLQLSVADESSE